MSANWLRRVGGTVLGLAALAVNGGQAVAPQARSVTFTPSEAGAFQGYSSSIRRPRGIYVVAVLDRARESGDEDLDALLGNPAVSGAAVRVFWSTLQPAKDKYDFSKIDAVFAAAVAKHKTVQLILLPGFGTPSWVLDELTSCDDLRSDAVTSSGSSARGRRDPAQRGGRAGRGRQGQSGQSGPSGQTGPSEEQSAQCGKQTFDVSEGARHGQAQQLPLPWNPTYKAYWRTFLTEVASRYGGNEAFVSIAVTGPTAESAEIIMPRTGNQLDRWAQLLELSYHDSSYHRTDKAFVDEWHAAVVMFGEVFRNVTLVLTRGSGLLNFSPGQDAAAQVAITSAFGRQRLGSNAKATQTSGLKACRETAGGIRGVKEMSTDKSLPDLVLGGAQFDTSFSQKPGTEGCPTSCDKETAACQSLTPRDALTNVLTVFFDGTPAGKIFGSSTGAARMNYMQVYAPDIAYAAAQPAVQALLEKASEQLLKQAR